MSRLPIECVAFALVLSCNGSAAPGAADPHVPECPLPFYEPAARCALPEPPPIPNCDERISWDLPEEAHCGPDGFEYWVTEYESIHLALEVESGPAYDGPVREVAMMVLVDGLASRFVVDRGDENEAFSFLLEKGSSRSLEVELSDISPGKHSVNVVLIFGRQALVHMLSVDLVLLKDATCMAAPLELVESYRASVQDGMWYLVDGRTGQPFGLFNREVEALDGRVPLIWHVAAAEGLSDDRALVVLLDGQQVAAGDLGMRPYLQIPVGTDDREVEFELRDLPGDGAEHQVNVLMIAGLDVPVESVAGEYVLGGRPWVELLASFRVH